MGCVFFDVSPIVNLKTSVVITRQLLRMSYLLAVIYLHKKISCCLTAFADGTEKERFAFESLYCHSVLLTDFRWLSFRMVN